MQNLKCGWREYRDILFVFLNTVGLIVFVLVFWIKYDRRSLFCLFAFTGIN